MPSVDDVSGSFLVQMRRAGRGAVSTSRGGAAPCRVLAGKALVWPGARFLNSLSSGGGVQPERVPRLVPP